MLCNYHRRKMQDQATEDDAKQLTNTEAQIYMQGDIPGNSPSAEEPSKEMEDCEEEELEVIDEGDLHN